MARDVLLDIQISGVPETEMDELTDKVSEAVEAVFAEHEDRGIGEYETIVFINRLVFEGPLSHMAVCSSVTDPDRLGYLVWVGLRAALPPEALSRLYENIREDMQEGMEVG